MTPVDVDALAKLREALAVALAETYTGEHGARNPDWDWEKPDGPDNPYHLTREMTERVEQSPYVTFTAGDGCRSMRMPSCIELADALLPVVDRIANERAAAELEAAAEECEGESSHAYDEDDEAYEDSARRLRDRAAALRASNGEGT